MTTVSLAQTDRDLRGILDLQQQNQVRNLTAETQIREGFVTIQYTMEEMRRMHQAAPSIIAQADNRVVGYAIAAIPAVRTHIPALESLFALIDTLTYQERPLTEQSYYLMGQICVADGYRGQGLFDRMYEHHHAVYGDQYRLLITDISARNARSLRAHERVGFRPLVNFREPDADEEWVVVVWDWNNNDNHKKMDRL